VYWWNPTTAIKVLHGTAYRPPNAYEREYRVDLPGGVVGTAPLRSERVHTTELALEHAPTVATRMLLSVFRSSVTDLVSLDDASQPDRLAFNNASRVHVQGVEAEVEHRLRAGSRLRVAYGWQKARDALADMALTNSPKHLLKLQWSDSLRPPAGSGWQSGRYAVEAIGIGPRRTLQKYAPSGARSHQPHLFHAHRECGGVHGRVQPFQPPPCRPRLIRDPGGRHTAGRTDLPRKTDLRILTTTAPTPEFCAYATRY